MPQHRPHLLWFLYLVITSATSYAGNVSKPFPYPPAIISQKVAEGLLRPDQIPDPHWKPDACGTCHQGRRPTRANLRQKPPSPLCENCHELVSGKKYLHTSNVAPDPDMLKRMPESYRSALQRGRVVCTTCHDLLAQCLRERRTEKTSNSMFLRDIHPGYRSEPCYLCHDANAYQRMNPHEQIDEKGNIRRATCALCHDNVDKLRQDMKYTALDFNVKQDWARMCTGCHPWIPHPGGAFMFSSTFKGKKQPEHLTRPSPDMRQRMQRMAQRNGIILPLDPSTGKIYCATCHNPHAAGVVTNAAAASGAGADKRLRMKKICLNCHDK